MQMKDRSSSIKGEELGASAAVALIGRGCAACRGSKPRLTCSKTRSMTRRPKAQS